MKRKQLAVYQVRKISQNLGLASGLGRISIVDGKFPGLNKSLKSERLISYAFRGDTFALGGRKGLFLGDPTKFRSKVKVRRSKQMLNTLKKHIYGFQSKIYYENDYTFLNTVTLKQQIG